MALKFQPLHYLRRHPAIARSHETYKKHRYSTPLFIARETLNAFQLHNGLGMSASLSFYALIALIPMALLIFFVLSHLILSSDYAIVKLAILTSNLVPDFSNRIMLEVYNASAHQAAWGIFGIVALLWIVTPLASALRSAFYTIATMMEVPSFIQRKLKDVLAVLGILLMFFLFTFGSLLLEKIVAFFQTTASQHALINSFSSLLLTTLAIALFYRIFFPVRVAFRDILIGSIVTALLWLAMRPAFGLFLSMNQSYGAVFGGLKNVFISIAWLYYTFIIFLLGTELIGTLRRKDVLFLRGLFVEMPSDSTTYLRVLMSRYGTTLRQGDHVFHQGDDDHNLYYIVSGSIHLIRNTQTMQVLNAGDYLGEVSLLTSTCKEMDAVVISDKAEIAILGPAHMETLLLGEPQVALKFLKKMAHRLHNESKLPVS